MRHLVCSTVMATMLLCGANLALATGGHGGGGSTGGETTGGGASGSSSAEKDGAPGADNDGSASDGGINAALAECDRLVEARKIGQAGPVSGTVVSPGSRDCDQSQSGATK